ncbi:MAG: hypothetical protein ACI4LO_07750 [Anaerovoracaceae bacterium]
MLVYNEEKYVRQNIASFLLSDFPKEEKKFIYADGKNRDNTIELIKTVCEIC